MHKRTLTSAVAALGLFAVVGLVAALAPSIASLNLARAHSPGGASLTALTVTAGGTALMLTPRFSSTVYSYTARVHNSVAQVTVAGTPDGDGTVTGGQQVNLPAAGATRVNLVVSHTDTGTTTTQTYTVQVIREGTIETDRAALMDLYNNTGGASWTRNNNWGSTEPLGMWKGVFTSHDGRVTNLYLTDITCAGNNMVGTLPAALGNLDYLFFLNMCGNQLRGTIPDLSRLTYLLQLYLNNNQLSGTLPASLGNLNGLQATRFAGNALTGCVPNGLRYLVTATDYESLPAHDFIAVGADRDSDTDDDGDIPGLGLPFCTVRLLALSDVTLEPAFASDTVVYTASATHDVLSTRVTATLHNNSDTISIMKGADTYTISIPLDVGPNVITIEITPADDTLTNTYTVTVMRAPNTPPAFRDGATTTRGVEENTAAGMDIGDPVAATDTENDTLTYSLDATGAASFDIDESSGQLRTKAALDFEDKSRYTVTVSVRDSKNDISDADEVTDDTITITVTITVNKVDEAGTVTLSLPQPIKGTPLTAILDDPDDVSGSATWSWARSPNGTSSWTPISGVTSATYTAIAGDVGDYLRATASYTDGEGSGKTAEVVSDHMIGARALAPKITVVELVSNLTRPWDIAFTPDGTMLFTQLSGVLSSRTADGIVHTVTANFSDLRAEGETGLMGIVVDPDFASNRRFYTCQGHTGPEIQVIAWTINADYTAATRVADPLVGGLPASGGRHGGCRLRFGADDYLWIATGDAATGTVPQDLTSLGGKVLRVNGSTGAAAPGNPFGSRVYTYGHRNVQGIALRPGTSQMWTVEHGPTRDDEINLLTAGGNYGWDPVPGYNESVPMTDLVKFPGAIKAKWSSGNPTLATSGGIFLDSADWDAWNGRLAVATLKASKLYIFEFAADGTFVSRVVVPELHGTYGRLRTPMLGPDGALYLTTSNGGVADKILKVVPGRPPAFAAATDTQQVAENNSTSAVVATVTATDPDGERLTYTLGGRDAAVFSIANPAAGGLRANVQFDYETRSSYEVVVTASDPYGLSDSVTLTIRVSDVNEAPEFPSSETGVRRVVENTPSGVNIGDPVRADDDDNDTLTYSLDATSAASFDIDEFSGQLQTKAALDFEDKSRYTVTVSVRDSMDANGDADEVTDDTITVTIQVANLNEAPVFTPIAPDLHNVDENTVAGRNIGAPVAATDPENDNLTYSLDDSIGADSFSIDASSGQLRTRAALDYETGPNSYTVDVTAADPSGLNDTIEVTITVNNVDEDGTVTLSTTQPIEGTLLDATLDDPDVVDLASVTWSWRRSQSRTSLGTLISGATAATYTPVAADVGRFLRATASYTDEEGPGKNAQAVSTNRVGLAPVAPNEPPVFVEGPSTSRNVAENTPADTRTSALPSRPPTTTTTP